MKQQQRIGIVITRRNIVALITAFVISVACQTTKIVEGSETTVPGIQITHAPPKGAGPDRMEKIAGTVSGVKVKECKVVIFALTDVWWVQPYAASSDTSIDDDGKWENDTHLGREYAALLVKTSYKPPSTTGQLPEVKGPVLAIARVRAKD